VIGLPVITTRDGGQASYMMDSEDGYFVECGDINGLIGRLETVLRSFSKAKEMGDRGKKTFRELFIAKRTGDGFMKMYKEESG